MGEQGLYSSGMASYAVLLWNVHGFMTSHNIIRQTLQKLFIQYSLAGDNKVKLLLKPHCLPSTLPVHYAHPIQALPVSKTLTTVVLNLDF
jgi:hypothetical protein